MSARGDSFEDVRAIRFRRGDDTHRRSARRGRQLDAIDWDRAEAEERESRKIDKERREPPARREKRHFDLRRIRFQGPDAEDRRKVRMGKSVRDMFVGEEARSPSPEGERDHGDFAAERSPSPLARRRRLVRNGAMRHRKNNSQFRILLDERAGLRYESDGEDSECSDIEGQPGAYRRIRSEPRRLQDSRPAHRRGRSQQRQSLDLKQIAELIKDEYESDEDEMSENEYRRKAHRGAGHDEERGYSHRRRFSMYQRRRLSDRSRVAFASR